MRVDVLTLFPEFFESPLKQGLMGKAVENNLISVKTHNFREFSSFSHNSVDDTPYGGGSGMVLRPEPISACLDEVLMRSTKTAEKPYVIYPSPSGVKLSQQLVEQLSIKPSLVFICGRYEGLDQRVIEEYVDLEVSIGDYVLSGGEVATLTIIEAISRFIPGVLGNPESLQDESFRGGTLEFPHYTKPRIWRHREVPEILLSGHHEKINNWRKNSSYQRTLERRPDLLVDQKSPQLSGQLNE